MKIVSFLRASIDSWKKDIYKTKYSTEYLYANEIMVFLTEDKEVIIGLSKDDEYSKSPY